MNAKPFAAIMVTLLLGASLACANNDDQPPSGHNAVRKLGRGLANLLFGVVEVPNQITKTTAEHSAASGLTYGLPKGIVRWFGREVVGVYEIVTFPFPAPRGYQPIMQPEFPNEDLEP